MTGGSQTAVRFDLGNWHELRNRRWFIRQLDPLGGSGVDKLIINGVTTGYVDAGAGADSIASMTL